MTSPSHRQQLLSFLARLSFRLGEFKLSSGGTSDYYIDCRTTTLHAEGGRLTGEAILDLLNENRIEAEAVGGLTMGADPIVSNVATASAWRAIRFPALPCSMVSWSAKRRKHTAQAAALKDFAVRARESSSWMTCAPPAPPPSTQSRPRREAGMTVAAVVCIVEREEANGRPAVEAAARDAPFLRLFTANEVRAEHIRQLALQPER